MSFIDPNAECAKFKQKCLIELPDLSEFTNVKKLNLSHNYITKLNLDLFPPNVKVIKLGNNNIGGHIDNTVIPPDVEILELNNNEIRSFDGSGFKKLKSLIIRSNKLIKFIFPPHLRLLEIYDNELTELPTFPKTMRGIDFSQNSFKIMPIMNEELKELYCGQNQISILSGVPNELEELDASENNIRMVTWLPPNLKVIKLSGNKLKELPCIGMRRLTMLDISNNLFDDVPRLPPNITHFNISDNRLLYVTSNDFPPSIIYLDISNNVIEDIPYGLKIRCHTFKHHGNYSTLSNDESKLDDDDDYEYLTDTTKRGRQNTLEDYGFNNESKYNNEDYGLGYNGYNTKSNHYDNTNYGCNNKNDYSDYNRYDYYNYNNQYSSKYNYNTNYSVETVYQENLKNPLCVSVYNTKQVEL